MDGIRRSAGIDWAKDAHVVCVIDEQGSVLERYEVEHTISLTPMSVTHPERTRDSAP